MRRFVGLLVGLLAALAAVVELRRRRGPGPIARIVGDPTDSTVTDEHGAVRSIQGADLVLPANELARIWSPENLERLARTYWRFLSRVTLGVIRVEYTERERTVVLLRSPLRLLRFQAPEYEMDASKGVVRWRIEDGILVAANGRNGDGYLEIDVERCEAASTSSHDRRCGRLHVEVEVANFYPAIASRVGRWAYENTQSRIHVFVTYGFLRSLVRLDLDESRVGRFASTRVEDVASPTRQTRPSEHAASYGRVGRRSGAPSPTASA